MYSRGKGKTKATEGKKNCKYTAENTGEEYSPPPEKKLKPGDKTKLEQNIKAFLWKKPGRPRCQKT